LILHQEEKMLSLQKTWLLSTSKKSTAAAHRAAAAAAGTVNRNSTLACQESGNFNLTRCGGEGIQTPVLFRLRSIDDNFQGFNL
jgi:hypothetical protein